MSRLLSAFRKLLQDRSGATAMEYGIILAVLTLVIVAGIGNVFNSINALFADNNSHLVNAIH